MMTAHIPLIKKKKRPQLSPCFREPTNMTSTSHFQGDDGVQQIEDINDLSFGGQVHELVSNIMNNSMQSCQWPKSVSGKQRNL